MIAVVGVLSNDPKDSHLSGMNLLAAGENTMLRLFLLNAVVGVFSSNPKDSHLPEKNLLAGENTMLQLFLLNAGIVVLHRHKNFKTPCITFVLKQRFSLFTLHFSLKSWLKKCYKINPLNQRSPDVS